MKERINSLTQAQNMFSAIQALSPGALWTLEMDGDVFVVSIIDKPFNRVWAATSLNFWNACDIAARLLLDSRQGERQGSQLEVIDGGKGV